MKLPSDSELTSCQRQLTEWSHFCDRVVPGDPKLFILVMLQNDRGTVEEETGLEVTKGKHGADRCQDNCL